MQTPAQPLQAALAPARARRSACGSAWPTRYTAEICAGAGFDWLLIDGEHSPNDLRSMLQQLQAIGAVPGRSRSSACRSDDDRALIKQYLDIGVQTLLVPMVDTAEQAARVVRGDALSAATACAAWAARCARLALEPLPETTPRTPTTEICLLVQAESREALANLDAIAAVDGVDGVFIGPADLSASMGHVGHPGHPEVQAAIDAGIATVLAAGKAPGILTPMPAVCRSATWRAGALFVAVGARHDLLIRAATDLARRFKRLIHDAVRADASIATRFPSCAASRRLLPLVSIVFQ